MEERVKKEIEYYDKEAEKMFYAEAALAVGEIVDFEGFRPLSLASFGYSYELLKTACKDKTVLDWGCGNGVHTVPLAAMGAKKVIGIDLSEKLLELGRAKARAAGMKHKIKFLKMDCEKTDFSENEFDVIFDGGTFSSVDIKTALPELARILKPDGVLIGIETFGHNPLANFNRSRNVKSGKRTAWAAAHIFNNEGIELAEKYFAKIEIEYFHFLSWLLIPLIGRSWGKRLFDFAEIFDRQFLKIPFLKKYAFKVVFEFSQPKNND